MHIVSCSTLAYGRWQSRSYNVLVQLSFCLWNHACVLLLGELLRNEHTNNQPTNNNTWDPGNYLKVWGINPRRAHLLEEFCSSSFISATLWASATTNPQRRIQSLFLLHKKKKKRKLLRQTLRPKLKRHQKRKSPKRKKLKRGMLLNAGAVQTAMSM